MEIGCLHSAEFANPLRLNKKTPSAAKEPQALRKMTNHATPLG